MFFAVGQEIVHPEYGKAIVRFVGDDRVGLEFPNGEQGLFKKESFSTKSDKIERQTAGEVLQHPSWPQSTFVGDCEDDEHYPGAHWRPFVDDVAETIKKLPDFLQSASQKNGLGLILKPKRTLPTEWEQGFVLAWPSSQEGIAIGIRIMAGNVVEPFSDFLGQNGWRARVRVLCEVPENFDLDIWVTEKVWAGEHPPQVGEDIEGVLWLQGHLWDTRPINENEN